MKKSLVLNINKSCVVIGSTRLCVSILNQLIHNNWNILCVVSDDTIVRKFCLENNLKLVWKLREVAVSNFVLFSISNYVLISEDFLNKHFVSTAINYHDSLLPRYAGVNSTTWAIYNNELTHGVSWHLISSGIDEGGILEQVSIEISKNETAHSLNFKCFTEAVRTFSKLLEKFEKGSLKVIEQDLANKTYYGKEHIPENYGFINFNDTYEKIYRLYRSLYFGDQSYFNSVASLKIWAKKNSYLVESIEFLKKEDSVPGYIYMLSESILNIGIKDGIISIKKLRNNIGKSIRLDQTDFQIDKIFNSYNFNKKESELLSEIKKLELKTAKKFESKFYENTSFFSDALIKEDYSKYQANVFINRSNNKEKLHKVICVLLKFINQDLCIPVKRSAQFESEFLEEFIIKESFLRLSPSQQELTYGKFVELIDSYYSDEYLIAKDLAYRYCLGINKHDVAIFTNYNGAHNDILSANTNRLIIFINDESVYLYGYQQDKILIDSMISSINYVINDIDIQSHTRVQDIVVIPSKDYNKILFEWNQTEKDYPLNKTICQLFQEQSLKTPNETALVFNEQSITYGELNEKSNQLAKYIRRKYQDINNKELETNTLIPIFVDRSLETVIGLLAILKAGAAYVPIAASYSNEWINHILKDTTSKLFLTQPNLVEFGALGKSEFCIFIDEKFYTNECIENMPTLYSLPNDLAYVIYTSGTTGKPKGVMIEHNSVVNTIWALQDTYDFNSNYRKTSCFSSFVFDVSVVEVFSSLLRGGELHLFDDEHKYSPTLLSKYINDKKINYIYLPPAILGLLPRKDYPSLKVIIFAGEPCDQSVGAYWATKYKLYNYYGPTECAIYATGKLVHERNVNEIGKPISNKKAYILDIYSNPVSIGVIGELYIGGVGQARGYLNQGELTRERFLVNHLQMSAEQNERLYKTGDLARWLPDGNIEYIGRNDFQVKIRGYRIELTMIEKALSSYSKIKQCLVLVKEEFGDNNNLTNQKSLIGFFIAEEALNQEDIIKHLKSKIPHYMVPSAFVQLEQFPITLAGKLDRAKLLSMQIKDLNEHFETPSTEIEKIVSSAWSDVLKINKIGLDDVFFQIGGNSLLAMALQTKLSNLFKIDLSVLVLFQHSTVRSLSSYIASQLDKDSVLTLPIELSDFSHTPSSKTSRDIAIIGMACRVPGANNIYQFWNNLASGVESIKEVTDDMLSAVGIDSLQRDSEKYVKRAANICDYLGFDAEFFEVTPREAQSIDPQHRHFMEVVFEALEDSGYNPDCIQEQVGLYAGQGESVYYLNHIFKNQTLSNDLGDFQLKINNDKDFLTTKISYKLNLKGPSVNIQTACSSSLVAIHIAISQILEGDCDIAVAGGVSIAERYGYKYIKGMIESPDGVCRAFDKNANGTVISSGVGAIVLKPLYKALEDKDNIHAIIKGTAINNDGGIANKVGYTAPSVHGQTQVIKRAIAKANIDPKTISYVEAHGTGTKIGDPIELLALHQVFFEHQKQANSIAVGSVKSNIGHSDAAAGVIGLIKTALALKNQKIPASLHFKEWNPEIERFNEIFYVNQSLIHWPINNSSLRRASVSSFGIGGTNAHAILEEFPEQMQKHSNKPSHLCIMSAKTKKSLLGLLKKLDVFVQNEQSLSLAEIAYTQHEGRKHWPYRSFIVSNHLEDLQNQLSNLSNLESKIVREVNSSNLIFMFPGQGTQYINMAADIYHCEPYFAKIVDYCSQVIKEKIDIDLLAIIFNKDSDNKNVIDKLKQTKHAQLALFTIEYAMGKFLMSLGVNPSALIGHSLGEYVAATLAGIFKLEDALLLVAQRGKLMQSVKPGAMLSVNISSNELLTILPDSLDLAAVNGPNLSVVSGEFSDIDLFSSLLISKGISHTRLHTSHAFHSRMMQEIFHSYKEFIEKIEKSEPKIPIISNVTGTCLTKEQAINSTYWCDHIRKPVLFFPGVKHLLLNFKSPVFVEIGPCNTLTTLVKQEAKEIKTINSLSHPKQKKTDYEHFLQTIGELWQLGINIDWKEFHKNEQVWRTSLPTYSFDHKDYQVQSSFKSQNSRSEKHSYITNRYKEKQTNNEIDVSKIDHNNELMNQMQEIWKSVLGLDVVKPDDNFFSLGGHSLLATQMARQIETLLDIEVELGGIFQNPSIRDMCSYIRDKLIHRTSSKAITSATDVKEYRYIPASAQQEALWVIQEMNGSDCSAYNEPLLFEINGDFSIETFRAAIRLFIKRHEILRTIFVKDQAGKLYQRILPDIETKIEVRYCEENLASKLILNEIKKVFNWDKGPLFRIRVYNSKKDRYLILMIFHHVITDGASLRILCSELSEIYNAICEKRFLRLPSLSKQYQDYTRWQQSYFVTETYQNKIAYWKEKLSNYQELNLSLNKPRSSSFSYRGDKHYFKYDENLSLKLRNVAKNEKTTLFNILSTGFVILLSRYCRQNDMMIGAPMLNRVPREFYNLFGFFTNTVILRNNIDNELSFRQLLRIISHNTQEAYKHQEIPFEHIISHLDIERDPSRNPLIQVLFLLVNKNNHPQLKFNNLNTLQVEPPINQTAKVDLTLAFFEKEDNLSGYFEYSTDVLEKNTVNLLEMYLQNFFSKIVDNLEVPLKNISIIDKNDELSLLIDQNPKSKNQFIKGTLHEGLIKIAHKYPNKIAVKMGGCLLTYAELDEKSNQLSRYIIERYKSAFKKDSMPRGTLIGICVEPSLDTIISILGILKAGAAYVPMDPHYPTERIEYILSDSKAPFIITEKKIRTKILSIKQLDLEKIILIDDEIVQDQIRVQQMQSLNIEYSFEDLAYVIYTSGSTGRPKGVLIPHKNVLQLFSAANRYYQFNHTDIWVLFHSFAFDVSVWEIWGTLLYGGTLVIVPYELTRDPMLFYEISKKERVTVLNQTPSAFRNYVDADILSKNKIDSLRYVIFAGEALDIEMLKDWWKFHGDKQPLLVNMYGITETTIHSTYQALSYCDLVEGNHNRIGVFLDHLRGYVLDEEKRLCPIGFMGELYIGGSGVANGYLNRDELTKERFILNPFSELTGLESSDRIYKSGDLVRWRPDGGLEYIGRTDFQVKLRGFRIELGEIESMINKHSPIKQSIVLMREENDNKYLVAYFTLNPDEELFDVEMLKLHLKQSLPEYMIPSAFVRLEKIPLTVNGKIDRRALPKPNFTISSSFYEAPTNQIELKITKIWGELLHIDSNKISIDANYFQLGGNSLSVVSMITKVKEFAGIDLPLSVFWRAPTIRALAKMIEGENKPVSDYFEKFKQLIINDLILPDSIAQKKDTNPAIYSPKKVLVTGGSGFLGIHLINELCKIEGLEVYCLMRSKSAIEGKYRLDEKFIQNNMFHLVSNQAIKIVCGDLSLYQLGLLESDYANLADSIDVIYHNGALVHHLYDYERMRLTNVCSTREILKLAMEGKNKAVHFVSTISVKDFDINHKLKSQDLNWSFLELNGYLLTKWVSEQLIIQAANRGVSAYIYRPGNITGHSSTGYCQPEFNHTLLKVKGFVQLGQAYFNEKEVFEMTPVDLLAEDIVRKSLYAKSKVIFNLDNPAKITFSYYLQRITEGSVPIRKLKLLSDWQQVISSIDENNALYPLKAFYDHYEEQVEFEFNSSNTSDLTIEIPEYELLISKQLEFLKKIEFLDYKIAIEEILHEK